MLHERASRIRSPSGPGWRNRATLAGVALLLASAPMPSARAGWEWSYTVLHLPEWEWSIAYATTGFDHAGYRKEGGVEKATRFVGSSPGWIDLHPPFPEVSESRALAATWTPIGTQQAGYARVGVEHACIWLDGTVGGWRDIHPANAWSSMALGIANLGGGDTLQAGHVDGHACIWYGTPESCVDLHPTDTSPLPIGSYALATAGEYDQAGQALFEGGVRHACIWSGTPESYVDLHPLGAGEYSGARATSGGQQAGYALIDDEFHACIWRGSKESFVDLHPSGASMSFAYATTGTYQAGEADFHACVWAGTADSLQDLHDVLPPYYLSSEARAITYIGATGTLYVAGCARSYSHLPKEAILWSGTYYPDVFDLPARGVWGGFHMVWEASAAGTVTGSYLQVPTAQPPLSEWGYRDGASDGQSVYFGWEGGVARHNADGSSPVQLFPDGGPNGTWRALAYDPTGDGGNGSLWSANFASDLVEAGMTGAILNTYPADGWSLYGLAYDDDDGNLWGHTTSGAVIKIDTAIGSVIPGAGWSTGFANLVAQGGLSGFRDGTGRVAAISQGTSDELGVYDLTGNLILGPIDLEVQTGSNGHLGVAVVAGGSCPADINGDGAVDAVDLLAVLAAWGNAGGPEDINGDGIVDLLDLFQLLASWGPCP